MYDINFFAISISKHRKTSQRKWFMGILYGVVISAMVLLYLLVGINIRQTEDEIAQINRMIEVSQEMQKDFISESDIANLRTANTTITDLSIDLDGFYLINANTLKNLRSLYGDVITLEELRINGKNVYMKVKATDQIELLIFQNDLESNDYFEEARMDNLTRTELGEYVANINCKLEGGQNED